MTSASIFSETVGGMKLKFGEEIEKKLIYQDPSPICWVRIDQRVGYELTESGYERSDPVYESSGYETSMGTKRLVSLLLVSNPELTVTGQK